MGAVLKFGELVGRKQRMKFDLNWISHDDVRSFCALSGLDLLTSESHQIIPFNLMGLGHLMNRWLAPLPIIRALNLRQYVVVKPTLDQKLLTPSVSVIVPVRNEAGQH